MAGKGVPAGEQDGELRGDEGMDDCCGRRVVSKQAEQAREPRPGGAAGQSGEDGTTRMLESGPEAFDAGAIEAQPEHFPWVGRIRAVRVGMMSVDPDPVAGTDGMVDATRDEAALSADAVDPFVAGMAVATEPRPIRTDHVSGADDGVEEALPGGRGRVVERDDDTRQRPRSSGGESITGVVRIGGHGWGELEVFSFKFQAAELPSRLVLRTRTQPEGRYSYSICNLNPATTQPLIDPGGLNPPLPYRAKLAQIQRR